MKCGRPQRPFLPAPVEVLFVLEVLKGSQNLLLLSVLPSLSPRLLPSLLRYPFPFYLRSHLPSSLPSYFPGLLPWLLPSASSPLLWRASPASQAISISPPRVLKPSCGAAFLVPILSLSNQEAPSAGCRSIDRSSPLLSAPEVTTTVQGQTSRADDHFDLLGFLRACLLHNSSRVISSPTQSVSA